jgi:hypothetical protein
MQNLYQITTKIDGYNPAYVIAEDPTTAQNRVEAI